MTGDTVSLPGLRHTSASLPPFSLLGGVCQDQEEAGQSPLWVFRRSLSLRQI